MADPKYTKALLALLFVGVLMGAVDLAIVGPALPAIQAEFGLPGRQLSVLLNAYILCQMLGAPVLAKLSDRLGPRAIYIFSIACFAAGSLLLVVATDKSMLFIGRGVQGFGAGGIFPVAAALIGTQLSPKQRGPALGVLGSVWGTAFLIGPVLGGIFLRFSWQWLFIINLPIAALLIIGAIKLLPAASPGKPKRLDLTGVVTLSIALTALVVGLNRLDTTALIDSVLSWPVGIALMLVVIMVPLFWRNEKRAIDPIIRPGFFESRQIRTTIMIAAGAGALQAGGSFYPALAIAATGVTDATAAGLLLPGVIAATLASPIAGRLINTLGTRTVISTSLALVLVSINIYAFTELSVATFVLAGIIGGTGMSGVIGAPIRLIVLNESSPSERGASQGLVSVFMSIGRLVGAAIVGSVAASAGGGATGYQAAFAGMALLAAALIIVALTLRSRRAEQLVTTAAPAAASA